MRIAQIFLLAFIFSSCTTVYFQEAQPQKVESLKSFPESAIGTYTLEFLDTFIIEKGGYSFPVDYGNTYSLAEVDSNPNLEIIDGFFYDRGLPISTGLKYEIKNDSLYSKKRIKEYKPISDSLVIKSYKEYLIVNEMDNNKGYWKVFILEPKGRDYMISMVGDMKSKEDSSRNIQYFEKITHFEKISDNTYLINPTKAEFKKLISKDFFSSKIKLKRVK